MSLFNNVLGQDGLICYDVDWWSEFNRGGNIIYNVDMGLCDIVEGMVVEKNSFHRAGHAVETMDTISQAPSLPVNIYLDEIDKLGNYESILP